MAIDFTKVNLTSTTDLEDACETWTAHWSSEPGAKKIPAFAPYRRLLAEFQVIVGFGKGFWGGMDVYYYLVYHPETEKYYWFLRNEDSDTDVYFYEFEERPLLLNVLETKAIESHFDLYDNALRAAGLFALARGETNAFPGGTLPEGMRLAPLADLFGEDTEALRIALMYFHPGNTSRCYPHQKFHQQVFVPEETRRLQERAERLNQKPHQVYVRNGRLYAMFGKQRYQLVKTDD